MKSSGIAAAQSTLTPALIALVYLFTGTMREFSTLHAGVETNLNVSIGRTNNNVVLNWYGSNGIPYQVESSLGLAGWTNSSPVLAGSGGPLLFTNPVMDSSAFFRVKQLPSSQVISSSFDPLLGTLRIIGDDLDNVIVVSRNSAGNLLVNGGSVPTTGGVPTVANTLVIEIFGRRGNDQLSLDESNGALPRANIFGEAGADTLTGGSGSDTLDGGDDADILLGRGGFDLLFGGNGNDVLTGGDADDQAFGEAGNDRLVWNPGDDTDLNEGGADVDTIEVNGGNGAEQFTVTANGTRVRFDRINPAPFALDIGTSENLVLNANGGDDSFSATGNLAALIQITVDGGTGADTLLGSNGADILIGGDSDDFIDGQQGNDTVFMGAGDDTFQWDPGDGSDTVEGQADTDKIVFNGSAANEIYDASANGGRVRFTRNIGAVVLDFDDVETLELHTLAGTDMLSVNDLAGTDLTALNADLASTLGGATGDGVADTVIVNGTTVPDTIQISADAGAVIVSGLAASVRITASDPSSDNLTVNGLGGLDVITTGAGASSLIGVTVNQ